MRIPFTRMVLPLVGITFGFFISCTTFNSTSKKTAAGSPEFTIKQELKAEIEQVSEEVSGNPSADLYYHKGYLLSEYAQQIDEVSRRAPVYEQLHEVLKNAEKHFQETGLGSGIEKVDALLKVNWSNEHNNGVEILQADSTLQTEDLDRAAAHFKNAAIILPDTVLSYQMHARALYRNGQASQALEVLEDARKHVDNPSTRLLEQLGFLYLETGSSENAILMYRQALKKDSSSLQLSHGLVNAYLLADRHSQAIQLLNKLSQNSTQPLQYSRMLADAYYRMAADRVDMLRNSGKQGDWSKVFAGADSLLKMSEMHYSKLLSQNKNNIEARKTLALFYQNAAADYHALLKTAPDTERNKVESGRKDFLRSSVTQYEELTDLQPEESSHWADLYRLYSLLGMEDRAAKAKTNIN